MTSKLVQLGVVLLLLGATVLITPSFGFETLAADRIAGVDTASDENATVGFEETAESVDNRSDSAVVFRLRNNAGQDLTFATSYVLGIGDLLVSGDGSGTVSPGDANGVTVECGDYGGDADSASITVTVTTASGDTLTITDASSSTTFQALCNVPAIVWETDADWSDAATHNRTVSDAVGDRESDTVRLGYGVDDANLVGYWPLDEDSGSTATDATANDNHGTVNGDPALGATGLLNATSYDFDGDGDYVSVPNRNVLEPANQVTVSAWIRRDGAQAQWAKPVFYGQNSQAPYGPYGFQFDDHSDTNLHFHLGIDGNQERTSTVTLNDGEWHHVVGTYDGSTQAIYLDGQQVHSTSVSGTISDYDDSNGLGIGDRYETGQEFGGNVDEVRIYDRGLSADEVADLYRASVEGSHTTDWKTADGEIHTDRLILDNVSTRLADGSATVTVQADHDGDGTVDEESAPVQLADDTDRYDVTGLNTDADRFRLEVNLSTPDLTRTPVVESVELAEDHSNFSVSVDDTNEPVVEGNPLDVDVTVENTGSDDATKTVELRDFGGTVVDSREVTLDARTQTQLTLTWGTSVGDNGTGTVTVDSGDDEATESVTIQQAPTFSVTVDGTNSPVDERDALDVDASVTNDGDLSDTQTIELLDFGSSVVDSTDVTLDPGETKTVSLAWSTADGDAGTNDVTVRSNDDSVTQQVTVNDVNFFDSCRTIDSAGTWKMSGDILHSSGTDPCIGFSVNDATIDGQNYTIQMDGTGDDAISENNDGSADYVFENFTIDGGNHGIWLHRMNSTTVRDVTVENAGSDGIDTYNPDGAEWTIENATFYDISTNDIEFSGTPTNVDADRVTIGDPTVNGTTLSFTATVSGDNNILRQVDSPSSPPAGEIAAGHYFEVNDANSAFEDVRVHYDDGDVADIDESTLALWRDDGSWTRLDSTVHAHNDTVAVGPDLNTVADFGLFGTSPSGFGVTVDNTSAPVVEGEDLFVNATVVNHDETQATQTIELRNVTGTVVDSTDVTVDANATESVTLTWTTSEGDAGTGDVNVSSDDDFDTAEVTVEKAGNFSVAIDDTSQPVDVGETLQVDATITNVGPGTSTQTVNLTTAGVERDQQSLTLDASESQSVTLEWATSEGDVGIYDATVASPDDSDVAEVSVVHPDGALWYTDADWSAGTHDRTVSDGVGDRESDTVRLGYNATDSGLLSYWPLDEDSGSTATDVVGENDARHVGDGITQGQRGLLNTSRYQFDGTSRLNVTNRESLQLGGDFAISLWVRTDSLGSSDNADDQTFFVDNGNYATDGYELIDNGGHTDEIVFRVNEDGANHDATFARSEVNDDQWHHLVGVRDGTEIRIYLDGQEMGNASNTGIEPNTDPIGIGGSPADDGNVTGDMEEVRIYDRALSDSEVAALNDTTVDGSHTTDWKPTGNALNASILQLQNVSATTAGQNATVFVESDTDNDGVVDETSDGVRLAAGQSTYDVTGLATDATRTRLRVEFSTDDRADTPIVSRVELGEKAPTFDVTIDDTDEPVTEGEDLTVNATVTNVGTSEDTQTIELRDFDGTVVDTTNVTLSPDGTNGSIALTWATEVGENGTDDVTVASPGDSATRQVTIEDGSQFDVTIDGTSEPVTEGEALDVNVTVDNTGVAGATQTVELRDFGGTVVDSTNVTLAAGGTNSSVSLTWSTSVGDNGTDDVTVDSDDDSAARQVTIDQQATFDVNVTGTNSPVDEGQALTVDVNVTNVGDVQGTQTIELADFGDVVVDSTDVTLGAGASNDSVTLEWATEGGDAGTGDVAVASDDDSATRQVTVEDGSQFDVTVDGTSEPVTEGEALDVHVTVTNSGTAADTETIELRDFDGMVVDSTDVALNASESNSSVTLTWATEVGDNGTGDVNVSSPDDHATRQVTVDQQATFDVGVTGTNAPVTEGDDLTVDVSVTNTGDVQGTQTVALADFDGTQVDSTDVTLNAGETNSSITLVWSTQAGDNGTDAVTVSSDDDTATESVTIEQPAHFDVTIDSTNSPVTAGEDLAVDVTVQNTGDEQGTQTVELRNFTGTVVDTTDVTLAAGGTNSSITLNWSTESGDSGSGDVTVASENDTDTASATIDPIGPQVKVTNVAANVNAGEDTQYFEFTVTEDMTGGHFVRIDVSPASDSTAMDYTYSGGESLTVVEGDLSSATWETHSGGEGPVIQLGDVSTGDTINVSVNQYTTQSDGGPWTATFNHDNSGSWTDDFEIE